MSTYQSVELDSKEGKAFLRKVIRHNTDSNYDNAWRIHASATTDWRLEFRRTIKGAIGEPDEDITVRTDSKVGLPSDSKTGREVQSFHDSKPVWVCRPTRIFLNGETTGVARLLLDGYRLEIQASAGSTPSSQHGISIYSVEAHNHKYGYYGYGIGGETLAINGRAIIRSTVDID